MKLKNVTIIALSLLVAGAVSARADQLEFLGSTATGVSLHSVEDSDTETTIAVVLGAGYFFTPMLEAFVEGTYSHYSSGGSNSSHSLGWVAGPRFNFGPNPESAFYAGFGLGEGQPTGSSNHTFSWQIHAGKRFELFSNVSWAPEAQYVRVGGESGGSYKEPKADWNIFPFRFSILL